MKIAVVAPSPVPFTRGGAERALWGIQAAINDLTHHEAEMVKIPVDESTLPAVIRGYETFAALDLGHFDRIITTKYPSWMVDHPHKTVLMMHALRGLYDTYHVHGQPLECQPRSEHAAAMVHLITGTTDRAALPEFFERFRDAVAALGPGHPDLAFPGPFARLAVRWLDAIGMAPGAVATYLSQSHTVARREGYFPIGVRPRVVNLPGHLPPAPRNDEAGRYLFTASRLDGPKRLDLLIDAMAHVPGDVELRIAGTGSLDGSLRARAAHDPRIRFLGFTRNDQLPELYANALAVGFIPADEDLGLITLEAFSQGTAVVTCSDSGGPTEFITDGVNGLIAEPTATSIGHALARLVADRALAARLGEAGRRRGEQITWDAIVDALLDRRPRLPPPPSPDASWPARPASPGGRRTRVVVTTTFPIAVPRHGGQLRARNLYGALARTADVEVISLVDHGNLRSRDPLAPGLTQSVIPRSAAHAAAGDEITLSVGTPASDVVAGTHIALSPAYLRTLDQATRHADVVIVAEPYLFPAVEVLAHERPVILDAYNVEADLKTGTYADTAAGRDLLAAVADIERRAVARAEVITTCSAIDADRLALLTGRDRRAFTVIPNGTSAPATVPGPTERRDLGARWRERHRLVGSTARPQHLAVFFGSWHPPNLDAVELLDSVATELPQCLFLSIGTHTWAFADRIMAPNLVFLGVIGDRAKTSLLDAADVAVNPMRIGSGTNLKLIEYLAAGVPTVSTTFGARGIEVVHGEHLLLAPPEGFAAGVTTVLDDPDAAAVRAAAGRARVRELYGWESLGARLARVIETVVGRSSPGGGATRGPSASLVDR